MACVTTPTRTVVETETSNSVSTSLSDSLTTIPASTITFTSTLCVASGSASGDNECISSTTVTSLSTVNEIVNTVQVPVFITLPVTRTNTETLFGTSCSSNSQDTPSSHSPAPTPPPTQPSPSLSDDKFSVSYIQSEYTPPPVVIESKSYTTLPGGSVSESIFYSTSHPPPSQTAIPTLVPKTQTDDQQSGPANVGAVIGGALGGFFGLIAIVLVVWFIMRRRRRWNDIFDDNDEIAVGRKARRFSLDVDDDPKPYQYGLVGHVTPPPAAGSPPSSPPATRMTLDPLRIAKTTGVVPHLSISSHESHHSRVSTAGSSQMLMAYHSPTPSSHSPASSITRPVMQHAQQDYFAGIDIPDRVGSPTSFREPRRLQIANETRSPTASVFSLPEENVGSDTRRQSVLPAEPPPYSKD